MADFGLKFQIPATVSPTDARTTFYWPAEGTGAISSCSSTQVWSCGMNAAFNPAAIYRQVDVESSRGTMSFARVDTL